MNAVSKIETATLHSAMAAAFGEIEAATKSANNPHFKSKYADIGAVIEAIKPALIKHSLFFTQHPQPSEEGVTVETMLHHAGGESLSMGSLYVPANKRDAQGFGSALTYARRYALQTAFGVPTEDDDGNAAARSAGGQSESTVSPRQSDEPKKEPAWREPGSVYSTPTALHKGLTAMDHHLNGCGDSDMVYAVTDLAEWKEFVRIAELHSPHYLRGGEPAPPEFEGLLTKAERLVREFDSATANNMTALAGA